MKKFFSFVSLLVFLQSISVGGIPTVTIENYDNIEEIIS